MTSYPSQAKVLAIQASGCTPAASTALPSPPSPPDAATLLTALEAANTTRTSTSCYKVKMSRLFNGWLDVKNLPAVSGSTVQLEYSGHVDKAQEWAAMDSVVVNTSVLGGTDFSNRFNWHEFQYVTVTGNFVSAPKLSSFTGRRYDAMSHRYFIHLRILMGCHAISLGEGCLAPESRSTRVSSKPASFMFMLTCATPMPF